MSPQQQADAILAKAAHEMTPLELDDLFLKLAQDREALLKAAHKSVALMNEPLVDIFIMRVTLTAAIAQAESK